MAELALGDAVFVAVALADEAQSDLQLLGEAQRLDLDHLRLAWVSLVGTALRRHADVERYLREREIERQRETERETQRETERERDRQRETGGLGSNTETNWPRLH